MDYYNIMASVAKKLYTFLYENYLIRNFWNKNEYILLAPGL